MRGYTVTRHARRTGEVTGTHAVVLDYVGNDLYEITHADTDVVLGRIRPVDDEFQARVYALHVDCYGPEVLGYFASEQEAVQRLADWADGYTGEADRKVRVWSGRGATWSMADAIITLGFDHVAELNPWVRSSADAHQLAGSRRTLTLTKPTDTVSL